jgi:conjugal transfer pilus assembly protein TraF
MKRLLFLFVLLVGMASSAWPASFPPGDEASGVFFDRRRDGWFWYLELRTKPKQEAPAPDTLPPTLEEMRKEADRLLARAIETPTEVNVAVYMNYQQQLTTRAEQFARIWQRVLWTHPELDPTVGEPVAAAGSAAMQAQQAAEQDRLLQALARTSGLLYFYSGNCPLCAAQTPLLSAFAQVHGFSVIPISLDGSADPLFPQSRIDHGAAQKLGVKSVPALFLARPPHDVTRVGTGFLTIEELARRLIRIARPMPLEADLMGETDAKEITHEEQDSHLVLEPAPRIAVEPTSVREPATATR